MKLYTVIKGGAYAVMIGHVNGGFIDVWDFGFPYDSMNEFIDNTTSEQLAFLEAIALDPKIEPKLIYAEDRITICSPIPVPKQDIICLGANFRDHIEETANVEDFREKEDAIYFAKRANYTTGPGEIIPCWPHVTSLDYEVELGVVIGKDALNVAREEAVDYILGYTIINDISARNLQFKHKQWYRGKSQDGHTPMGPCIVTAFELGDGSGLRLTCKVNGELRQDSNTDLLIQDVAGAVSELSEGMTLKKGTIIAMGTPGGVGFTANPPALLHPGDIVECEIEKIGVLRNECR